MKYELKKWGGASALAITFLVLLASSVPAFAGGRQTDTNNLVVNSTNTFILYGDASGSFTSGELASGDLFIDVKSSNDAFLAVSGYFTNSTAGSSNVTFRIAQSLDLANWTNSAQAVTLVVPAGTTNWVTAQVKIHKAWPYYGLRAIENPNTGGITAKAGSCYVKAYTKEGI